MKFMNIIKEKNIRKNLQSNFVKCCTGFVEELFQSGVVSYERNLENGFQAIPWSDPEEPELEKREIYEWWQVNPWFLQLLRKKKAPVLFTDYGNFWGRCSTEPVFKDSIVESIFDDLYS